MDEKLIYVNLFFTFKCKKKKQERKIKKKIRKSIYIYLIDQ